MNQNSQKTNQSPPNRQGIVQEEKRWFAVYTRYKREKIVVKRLQEKNITAYVPLQQFTRYYTRKIKKVELPLISCYIFVQITRAEYISVLETSDIVSFVKVQKDLVAIPEREINILRHIVGEGLEIEVSQSPIKIGQEAEIIGGRLTGLKGKVISQHGDKNFVIELQTLKYNLHMQVPKKYLQALGGHSAQISS
jgi:transcription antitermination factor NusG